MYCKIMQTGINSFEFIVIMERSGSVVECLTRDRGAAGSILTALWSLSKIYLS